MEIRHRKKIMHKKKNLGKKLKVKRQKLIGENKKVFTRKLNETGFWDVQGNIMVM